MGADIHLFAECRDQQGNWHHLKNYRTVPQTAIRNNKSIRDPWLFFRATDRNYEFFATLAGVRGEGPDGRGLPEDVSPLVLHFYTEWGEDAHTPSWYSAEDFCELFFTHKLTDAERAAVTALRLKGDMNSLTEHILDNYLYVDEFPAKDVRFVFWFDN